MSRKNVNKTSEYTLTFGEKIQYGLLFSICYTISLIPLSILYAISDILIYPIIRNYRKQLVRKNLTESFPQKSSEEIDKIMRKHYHFLADYIVETIKMMSISRKDINKRVKYTNMHLVNDAERAGKSVSLYIAHHGNWEWITSIGLHLLPTTIGGQVYHILENRVADKLFIYIRQRMGTVCVPMSEILRKRIECKQNEKVLVMGYISDQTPFWNNIHYWTPFLNHDTPVLTGAEKLTKRFHDVAVYLDVKRPRRGYYDIDIRMLSNDSGNVPDYEITEKYFRALEATIIKQPEIWLWTHNRWKRTREAWEHMYDPTTGKVHMYR